MVSACSMNTYETSSTNAKVEVIPPGSIRNALEGGKRPENRIAAPGYEEIKQRYDHNASDFNRLAAQLERDPEVTELYCDTNMVVVTTPEDTFYVGDGDPYTSKYERLCRFTRKVIAYPSVQGIRFPHSFFEFGELVVSSFLEKRAESSKPLDSCGSPLFEGERGTCAIPIYKDWSAIYEWRPFCLDDMEGEVGC